MAVELVVDPSSIEVTVDDIGGLDDILERLVLHSLVLLVLLICQLLCLCNQLVCSFGQMSLLCLFSQRICSFDPMSNFACSITLYAHLA